MLLDVDHLSIYIKSKHETKVLVRNISFHIGSNETLGVIGESGCGKSILSLSLMGLLPDYMGFSADRIKLGGQDLQSFQRKDWQKIRGTKVAMIFQNPMSCLNPCLTIQTQIFEVIKKQDPTLRYESMKEIAVNLLEQVGIRSPEKRLNNYPHELSGGMAQRVMIAMAIASKPDLLIADEPTTSLDANMQVQVLDLLKKIIDRYKMSMMLVSHDINLIKNYSDRLQVMYSGQIVEAGDTQEVLNNPLHPYTKALLDSSTSANVEPKSPLKTIPGIVLPITTNVRGCRFANRCFKAQDVCQSVMPPSHKTSPNNLYLCHF